MHDFLSQYKITDNFFEFISSNKNGDTNKLIFLNPNKFDFDIKFAVLQILCRQKIKSKLPSIATLDKFLFPSILSTEQCTAEEISKFHESLFEKTDTVLDMTSGLGIDDLYISKNVKHLTALEINPIIADISRFNHSMYSPNTEVINADCTEYIKTCNTFYDKIYIDPARRGDNNKRLFGLNDCQPNVVELLPLIKQHCNQLIIKASSMIDISQCINDLNSMVSDIWVVALKNECKELLLKIDFKDNNTCQCPNIHLINYEADTCQVLDYVYKDNSEIIKYDNPEIGDYLFLPNCCIMKANAFDVLSNKFNISKLHPNSHIFIAKNTMCNFPGKTYNIVNIIPFKDKLIKSIKNDYPKANTSVRNFKLSAEELKKRLKIKDGGETYIFGTTLLDGSQALIITTKCLSE